MSFFRITFRDQAYCNEAKAICDQIFEKSKTKMGLVYPLACQVFV